MKKRLLSLLFVLTVMFFAVTTVTACTTNQPPATPQKLSAPVVTLSGNLATWQEDLSADKFEISLNGNLSYVENIVTNKVLTNGQTLKVRAVGDGTNYTTSNWCDVSLDSSQ